MVTSAPSRLATVGDVVLGLAEHGVFRTVVGMHPAMAKPARHRSNVHRGVAAADHEHPAGGISQSAVVEGIQERDAADAIGRLVGARHRQRRAVLGAEPHEYRVELAFQLGKRNVDADLLAGNNRDAEIDDALDLGVEHMARRAIARNAVAHHAAKLGLRLEHA